MRGILDLLPLELLMFILKELSPLAWLRFRMISRRACAVASHDMLWTRYFSSTRPYQRCGKRLMTPRPSTALDCCRVLHHRCTCCESFNADAVDKLFPSGKYSHLTAVRKEFERSWQLTPTQVASLGSLAASWHRSLYCAVWPTRHGARCWAHVAADVDELGPAALANIARACILGTHDVPHWHALLPSAEEEMSSGSANADICHAFTGFFSLSAMEWQELERWLLSADCAIDAALPSPPMLRAAVALELHIRRSLLALNRGLLAGNCVLAFRLDAFSTSATSAPNHTTDPSKGYALADCAAHSRTAPISVSYGSSTALIAADLSSERYLSFCENQPKP